jgi:hypothetical protein
MAVCFRFYIYILTASYLTLDLIIWPCDLPVKIFLGHVKTSPAGIRVEGGIFDRTRFARFLNVIAIKTYRDLVSSLLIAPFPFVNDSTDAVWNVID